MTTETGMLWVMGRNTATGKLFLADKDGGRFDFDASEAASIAAALAEHVRNNDERAWVEGEWGPLWDDDEDYEPFGGCD